MSGGVPRSDGEMCRLYREAIDVCCCPYCQNTGNLQLETHHIVPITKDGAERDFRNYICLCYECHHGEQLHSRYFEVLPEVLYWKIFSELLVLGISSFECSTEKFRRILVASRRKMRHPGEYEHRIQHLYEIDDGRRDSQTYLTFDDMIERDDGRTDARIDAMHERVLKELNLPSEVKRPQILKEKTFVTIENGACVWWRQSIRTGRTRRLSPRAVRGL